MHQTVESAVFQRTAQCKWILEPMSEEDGAIACFQGDGWWIDLHAPGIDGIWEEGERVRVTIEKL